MDRSNSKSYIAVYGMVAYLLQLQNLHFVVYEEDKARLMWNKEKFKLGGLDKRWHAGKQAGWFAGGPVALLFAGVCMS